MTNTNGILPKRLLLEVFRDMLWQYVKSNGANLHDILKKFWNDNGQSISFYLSSMRSESSKKELPELDDIGEIDVMMYMMFHFAGRPNEWFKQDELFLRKEMLRPNYINMIDFCENYQNVNLERKAKRMGEILCKVLAGAASRSEIVELDINIGEKFAV